MQTLDVKTYRLTGRQEFDELRTARRSIISRIPKGVEIALRKLQVGELVTHNELGSTIGWLASERAFSDSPKRIDQVLTWLKT